MKWAVKVVVIWAADQVVRAVMRKLNENEPAPSPAAETKVVKSS